jgi:hypothetical protein
MFTRPNHERGVSHRQMPQKSIKIHVSFFITQRAANLDHIKLVRIVQLGCRTFICIPQVSTAMEATFTWHDILVVRALHLSTFKYNYT